MSNYEEIQQSISQKGFFYLNEGDFDAHLFHEGTFYKSYAFLGSHPIERFGIFAVRFIVWAPHANSLSIIGEFNQWHPTNYPMQQIGDSGLWQICIPHVKQYDAYKYRIITQDHQVLYKADPYAFHAEERPKTASKYYDLKGYEWQDQQWLKDRQHSNPFNRPIAVSMRLISCHGREKKTVHPIVTVNSPIHLSPMSNPYTIHILNSSLLWSILLMVPGDIKQQATLHRQVDMVPLKTLCFSLTNVI